MLIASATPAPIQLDLRRKLIRSAARAVGIIAPLQVTDPRGMIFDQAPEGDWTLRVRGSDGQMVLGLGPGERPWTRSDALNWHPLPLADDGALPGRLLLSDQRAIEDLVELSGPLEQSLVTYRRGRRAVVRVVAPAVGKARYVKLLNAKSFRREKEAREVAGIWSLERVLSPRKVDEGHAALVFDELGDPALHQLVWSHQDIDWRRVLSGIADLSRSRPTLALPNRNMETERDAAVRQLKASLDFLPQLAPLLEKVERSDGEGMKRPGVIHGDLHDKQIFLGAAGVRFIDAGALAFGDPRIDLVNLAEHIGLREAQGCQGAVELAGAFWTAASMDRFDPAIQRLRALVRARLAGVYARRPWWWGVSLTMATQASRLLDRLT